MAPVLTTQRHAHGAQQVHGAEAASQGAGSGTLPACGMRQPRFTALIQLSDIPGTGSFGSNPTPADPATATSPSGGTAASGGAEAREQAAAAREREQQEAWLRGADGRCSACDGGDAPMFGGGGASGSGDLLGRPGAQTWLVLE